MSFDLSTNYGGLRLRSPVIVGACPLTANTHRRIAMESAGAGAIVLPSLLEEHVIAWKLRNGGEASDRERRLISRVNQLTHDATIPDIETWFAVVDQAVRESSIPVIASLNGCSDGDWMEIAKELQNTGVDAIELNISHRPTDQHDDPRDAEDKVVEIVRTLRTAISIPMYLKLHREYTSVAHLARRIVSGVQGLVLYAPDPEIDITLPDGKLISRWGLSSPGSISPVLRALMSVYGHCPAMPLAGSGGIGRPEDVIKILLAGADAAMVTSAIYREGPDVIRTMLDGLTQFMECNRISSLNELQSRRPLEFTSEEDRLGEIQSLTTNPGLNGVGAIKSYAPVIESDQWGHRF